ncbi:MAG: DUF4880 domain-containing protein [Pseudomonas sp.]|nr:DUF4880 domain-containing protein [Pseudomonas sp.]
MNQDRHIPSEEDAITDAAAHWCMRLHADDCTAAEREAFGQWLASDPRHAEEYQAMLEIWDTADLRYVALEGGGEIATALLGGHIQVGSTDISDSMPHIQSGNMRILAVFSDKRLDEPEMKDIPTAKEQGYDIVWPVVRGFYLGPKVSDEDYAWWKASFDKLLASEDFAKLRDQRELFPFAMTGEELDGYVKKQVADYKALAREFGLIQ